MIDLRIKKTLNSAYGDMILELELQIDPGSFLTLFGRSGAGKTSLLRIIAGLLSPEEGRIVINDSVWLDTQSGINLRPQKRNAGFLFQDYALFPNMTVLENLKFALAKGQDHQVVRDLIDIIELGELRNQKPNSLSGGQRQRVALARALVQKPEILLLDEPLSALDTEMRIKLQPYILEEHREYGLTTIMVSHDISEILKMSDLLVEIDLGKIIKQGAPAEVFTQKNVSGKFQFTGEVISMEKQDFIFILTVLIGKDLVKVVVDENEAKELSLGDKVLVASKAFNPIIKKLI